MQMPSVPFAPVETPATVAAIRGNDLRAMTREALEAIGGIDAVVQPGQTVFIKPNFGSVGLVPRNTIAIGECTKPEIVATVAEECLQAGAAKVIIGDAAQVPRFRWDEIRTLDESTNLAAEAERLNATYAGEVILACLNADSPSWDTIPSPYSGLGEIYVSSLVTRADRIITIPVLKTHRWTQLSLAMKNFMGVTPVASYGGGLPWRFALHDAPGGLEQCFLDVVAAVRPDLTIIDASIGTEGNGPHVVPGWWGTTVDMRDRLGDWLILAGTDVVAVDVTAARIVGQEMDTVKHIDLAYRRGLGQARADLIEVVGAGIDQLLTDWQVAEPVSGFGEVIIPGLIALVSQ
jgi:uncharacterized protein (DUF362 family)